KYKAPRRRASTSRSKFCTAIAVSVSQKGTGQLAARSSPWPALSGSEYRDVYALGSAIGSTITGAFSTPSCVSANQASALVVFQNEGTASPVNAKRCTPWL